MNRNRYHRVSFAATAIAAVTCFVPALFAQQRNGLPPGVTREQMWFAPTAEDWKKPCLIEWQRTWDDAVAVAQETKKPILICVNMDGEIASEHYAGVRYRQPEIAKLYEPYVCVIASVYRHTPRDFDENGQRILCPRFGSVTCGEHIAIEPIIYEKYLDGQRVAPRHIAVELDGKKSYDVFYAWDTDTIFNALKNGVANRPPGPTIVRGDRPITERLTSHDIEDRIAVEAAYAKGDANQRRSLLEAAKKCGDAPPVDLLRLALYGFDTELAQRARDLLAKSGTVESTGLIGEALRVPMAPAEQEALVAALDRIGEKSPKARSLAATHHGLSNRSAAVDVAAWSKAIDTAASANGAAPAGQSYDAAAAAAGLDQSSDKSSPANVVKSLTDATKQLERAETFLARANEPELSADDARYFNLDARNAAQKAADLGAKGWRVNAALAVAAYQLGERDEARTRAEAAVGTLPADAADRNSMVVLALFVEARWKKISDAAVAKKPWPPEWLSDVNAAYTVLEHHPFGTDGHFAGHYDVMQWLGAIGPAARVLEQGLARFPDSDALHQRFRDRVLADRGVEGLEPAYASLLQTKDAAPGLEAFAGYASLVTAEFQRRTGHDDLALAAYDRAMAHYEHALTAIPEGRDTADHFIALALAGRARIAFEHDDDEAALKQLLASLDRRAASAATDDGLGFSPVATARVLLARLRERKKDALADSLDAALKKLDPELLKLPAYEQAVPPARREGGGPR